MSKKRAWPLHWFCIYKMLGILELLLGLLLEEVAHALYIQNIVVEIEAP